MQISRHWRLNTQRYRLEGFRNLNGEVSLQPRPEIISPEGSSVIKVNYVNENISSEVKISGSSTERRAG